MSRKNNKNISKRPSLFSSEKGSSNGASLREIKLQEILSKTNISSTSSFRYDQPGKGVVSTTQIPVDWSKFESHTFFNSAQSKVNVAFDTIINQYPFDGSQKELEAFFDNLTGYENYVYQKFPKHVGYLIFSGATGPTAASEGSFIKVNDSSGFLFPKLSRKRDGAASIEFLTNPFTIEFFIRVPDQSNDNQVVLQKNRKGETSVTIALSQSLSTTNCNLIFSIVSGSTRLLASASLEKKSFTHVSAVYDRDVENKAKLYFNSSLVGSSSNSALFPTVDTKRAPLTIGSGSIFSVSGDIIPAKKYVPSASFSGSLDELRIFHSIRYPDTIKKEMLKTIYPEESSAEKLKLYLKFNEASGSYTPENVVLDSSGNSLHSLVTNFKIEQRLTGTIPQPVTNEKFSTSPILFPDHYLVKRLNKELLSGAERYDRANPNIITKLIPPHLFLEGQRAEGFSNLQGGIYNPVTGDSIPGSAAMGSSQILTGFLLTYAKFFDELKIVLDSISNFLAVEYEDIDTVPDQFIPLVARYYGIDLPNLFSASTVFEFIDGEDLGDKAGYSVKSLRDLQNQLWKRFLINFPYIMKEKGTVNSVKSTIRSFGINPDRLMNIREFGGPTRRSLSGKRNRHVEPIRFLTFSGSAAPAAGSITPAGFSSRMPHIISPFLSSSRVEPGYPRIKGNFVQKSEILRNGISSEKDDGLLTSGSFSYEGIYRFPPPEKAGFSHSLTQSLVRMSATGSIINLGTPLLNVVAVSGSKDIPTKLNLYVRSALSSNRQGLRLVIEGANIFDGEPWHISCGRNRSDDIITSVSQSHLAPRTSNAHSSSYFLSCVRTASGKVKESHFKRGYLQDQSTNSAFENIGPTLNASGTIVVIGSQSLGSYTGLFLSDPNLETAPGFGSGDREVATATNFTGDVAKIRFWSSGLRRDQILEHAKNPSSYGSSDPRIAYSYRAMNSGSFERLRVDCELDQPVTGTNVSGEIVLTNYSDEIGNISGKSFESERQIIFSELYYISRFSPKFDLSQEDNKIRIRSYETFRNFADSLYAQPAPVHTVRESEVPDDDNRFAVEFSSVKALEDDIMSMFSELVFFDNALGRPDLLFDEIYPDLEQARKIYFRRLFAKPEYDSYFNAFKWFNDSLGRIIEQLVPRNTRFLGVDFVYESHPLERNRFRYLFDEIYMKHNERSFDRGDTLLSLYLAQVCKF